MCQLRSRMGLQFLLAATAALLAAIGLAVPAAGDYGEVTYRLVSQQAVDGIVEVEQGDLVELEIVMVSEAEILIALVSVSWEPATGLMAVSADQWEGGEIEDGRLCENVDNSEFADLLAFEIDNADGAVGAYGCLVDPPRNPPAAPTRNLLTRERRLGHAGSRPGRHPRFAG